MAGDLLAQCAVEIVAIPLILRALPESHGRRQPLDILGLALVGAGVLAAVWGIVRAGDLGWGSVPVTGPLVAAVSLIGACIRHEGRTAYPLVPLRLFRSRSFSVANVASLAFTLGMFGAVFLLAQYLQIVDGYTPLQAGVRTLAWTAAPMIVAPITGTPRAAGRRARAARLWTHSPASGVGLARGCGRHLDPLHRSRSWLYPGRDRDGADVRTAVLADMAPDDHGTASSTNSTIREIGVALGVAVLVAVFRMNGGTLTLGGYHCGLRAAILTGAAVVALGALSTIWPPRTTARTRATSQAPSSAN